jgi:glycosyltransferase involved in cell wall biosynthesis
MSLSLLEQARCAGLPALAVVGDEWVVYGPRVDGWTRRWRRLPGAFSGAVSRAAGVPARLGFDRAAQWSFNSEYTRSVSRAAGWRLPGATVDHPGVAAQHPRRRAAESWGWRLLCCGRIDSRKGIATAIRALALLPEAALTIHGHGDQAHAAALRGLAHELGVAERVTFSAGPRDRVAEVYAACDALVFPVSWREPWGLVPLEAMAAGRPVVATRAGGGAAEYLEAEINCLQFAPEDATGLAAALRRLAADPELRTELVGHGRATAARYPQQGFYDALERRLAEAVARGPMR